MTAKQQEMLSGAALDWLDRELETLGIPVFIRQCLRHDDPKDLRLWGAVAWMEENGFQIKLAADHATLTHNGKEISRFVWQVSD